MARAADDSAGGGGAPFAKFARPGDVLIGAFGGGKQRQRRDFANGDPIWKDADKKKPSNEEVMWFVAMPGTTAVTGDLQNEQVSAIDSGDVVRYSVNGFKWGQVIDQRKALPEYAGFKAGKICSGDVYEIRMTGWSAATENAQSAINAGFTVVDGRIVMTTEAAHEAWVMAMVKRNANTNAAKDFEITVRRPTTGEKRWEQAADELFDSRPWEQQAAMAGAGSSTDHGDEEPF